MRTIEDRASASWSDEQLVAAARGGDVEAFAAIYDRYADALFNACYRQLGNRDEAADVVQDTFVLVNERLDQIRDASRLKSWLYAIATRESLRVVRGRARSTLTDEFGDIADHDAGPEEVAERSDLAVLLRTAAEGLSPTERSVLGLHLSGLSRPEIAEAVGLKVEAVHVCLHRLRGQVELSLGALLVLRRGRRDCDGLATAVGRWDGRFSPRIRKRVVRHVRDCEACESSRARLLTPEALLGLLPFFAAPDDIRAGVMDQAHRVAAAFARGGSAVTARGPAGGHLPPPGAAPAIQISRAPDAPQPSVPGPSGVGTTPKLAGVGAGVALLLLGFGAVRFGHAPERVTPVAQPAVSKVPASRGAAWTPAAPVPASRSANQGASTGTQAGTRGGTHAGSGTAAAAGTAAARPRATNPAASAPVNPGDPATIAHAPRPATNRATGAGTTAGAGGAATTRPGGGIGNGGTGQASAGGQGANPAVVTGTAPAPAATGQRQAAPNPAPAPAPAVTQTEAQRQPAPAPQPQPQPQPQAEVKQVVGEEQAPVPGAPPGPGQQQTFTQGNPPPSPVPPPSGNQENAAPRAQTQTGTQPQPQMSGRFESASAVERPSPSSQVVQPGAQQATTYPAITATGAPAYAPDDPGLGAATYATASADPGGCIDSHCRVHAQVASTPRPAASQGLLDAEARLSQVNASENGTQGQQATTDGQTAATGGQTVTTTEGQATATGGQPQPGVTGLVSEDWTGALDNQAAANQAAADPSASPGLNGKVFSQGDATGLGGGLSPIYGKGVFTGGVITDLPVMPDTENPNG